MKQKSSRESFSELIEASLPAGEKLENTVVSGVVTDSTGGVVSIDFGFKSEGRVPVSEFEGEETPVVGDAVDVYVSLVENAKGECVLSRTKARRAEAWSELESAFRNRSPVTGRILNQVKGGYTVAIKGINVFLPGSQVSSTAGENTADLIGKEQDFRIIRFNMAKGNAVVSSRTLDSPIGAEKRSEMLANMKEGDIVQGIVKNITNYGAFIDLGFTDALLYVTDISWKRTQHPEDVLKVGEKLTLKVIKLNPEKGHINLSLKEMEVDPWQNIEKKYEVGKIVKGKITNIASYGVFIELEPGIEGLVHISKACWNARHVPLSDVFKVGQEVEAAIINVSMDKRRIALDMKQVATNPWETFAKEHKVGETIEGTITKIGSKNLFLELANNLEGRLALEEGDTGDKKERDTRLKKKYGLGEKLTAVIQEIKPEKSLILLDFKEKPSDQLKEYADPSAIGRVVTCTVSKVLKSGIKVVLPGDVPGFIPTNQLSSTRTERYPDRFTPKEKVDASITGLDNKSHFVKLSIRVVEEQLKKQAIETYGSSKSGALLGDILGVAITKKMEKMTQKTAEKPTESDQQEPVQQEPVDTDGVEANAEQVASDEVAAAPEQKESGEADSDKDNPDS